MTRNTEDTWQRLGDVVQQLLDVDGRLLARNKHSPENFDRGFAFDDRTEALREKGTFQKSFVPGLDRIDQLNQSNPRSVIALPKGPDCVNAVEDRFIRTPTGRSREIGADTNDFLPDSEIHAPPSHESPAVGMVSSTAAGLLPQEQAERSAPWQANLTEGSLSPQRKRAQSTWRRN